MRFVTQHELVQQVHASGQKLVLVVTGGGSGAIAALVGEPGASRSVLAAHVPYSSEALFQWLGSRPEQYCSERTARMMAMAAYLEARRLDPEAEVLGVACTASLASDRPKRGAHRAYIAVQTAKSTTCATIEFREIRSREEEESLLTGLILNEVAKSCRIEDGLDVPIWESETFSWFASLAQADEQQLLAGQCAAVPRNAARSDELPRVLFPGAFNPVHQAHRRMAGIASELIGAPVAFELSIENVDKPLLDFIGIHGRLRQFEDEEAIWLTRAPTFVRKAELFPGATFVVGIDTIERVGEERYYGHPAAFERAMELLNVACVEFLVFGRATKGEFRTLEDVRLPAPLAALCKGVPADVFREDVSSTELRNQERTQQE